MLEKRNNFPDNRKEVKAKNKLLPVSWKKEGRIIE
jgi:hypothetical protein